jgi:hypothetical protein
MSPGTRAPARPRAAQAATLSNGGYIFAERPEIEAPDARIIWHADFDPGALRASALPIDAGHPDAIDVGALAPWLSVVGDAFGEHAVLSDGRHHIRIDIENGTLAEGRPVMLVYRLHGIVSLEPKILPLRRLVDLHRHRRFSRSLYPIDPRIDRWLQALRVHDALSAGASQRDIIHILWADASAGPGNDRRSDSLRSRLRRLAAEARRLAGGGYRALMQQRG